MATFDSSQSSDSNASETKLLRSFQATSRASSTKGSKVSTPAKIYVTVPRVADKGSYIENEDDFVVEKVLGENVDVGEPHYRTRFRSGYEDNVSFDRLNSLVQGSEALARFQNPSLSIASSQSTDSDDISGVIKLQHHKPRRPKRKRTPRFTAVNGDEQENSEDELSREISEVPPRSTRRGLRSEQVSKVAQQVSLSDFNDEELMSESSGHQKRSLHFRSNRKAAGAPPRRSTRVKAQYNAGDEEEQGSSDADELPILTSDILPGVRKRKKMAKRVSNNDTTGDDIAFERSRRSGAIRQSQRSTRHKDKMVEADLKDIYRADSDTQRPAPKAQGAREAFQILPRGDPFQQRHCQSCDTCGGYGSSHLGPLINCQGCSLSYHKTCLGNRTTREHLVTKVGEKNFVLQCRRCISWARKKDATAPDQGMCQSCREPGTACPPFRSRKTALQEEREREENDGEDPVVDVDESHVNNVNNVLFRCTNCWRAFHFHHLMPRSDIMEIGEDDEAIAHERFREYCRDWVCRDCLQMPAKVSGLVAWRPVDQDSYVAGTTVNEVNEDEKEYLIKWDAHSYFQVQWMPGAWTWGTTASAMRKAFGKREGSLLPLMTAEEAIPEDYLRIDIILDVRFTSIVDTRAEEVDKARIREVDQALIKYKGLGYEDAVWERVPSPEDGERWGDFVQAYDDWVAGRYVKIPKASTQKTRVDKARATNFNLLEKKKQPTNLVGGQLMQYQVDGLNWLYYRWYLGKNAILSDEMGLGKTIQIIGLLATLTEDHGCFPFLCVVPNPTVPNWRREIKRWAPSLRVVTYYGSSTARSLAFQHELYPEGSKALRCHVVVTSYEAASDDSCKRFLRSVPWQGLIVDEGQRLKNDRNLLYGALTSLKIPYTVLLTGTPLQNNARELFNLLQFLDDTFDAAALELEYSELTKENIPQLHNLIRPFFLRRTKAEVLTFLPPMGQVIVPVSMSLLQKKLYTSILAKNPDLVKAIFSSERRIAKSERASLSNILMQLRKCLCHPFVYSRDIEEKSPDAQLSHRNLVDASAKLQLLELLLPKLRARGHRVLIFSQFLDMLDMIEDFLDGLELRYQRLDGTVSGLQKQKRIDQFNAPDSPLFAFLISTRAGGIGINLATADTVIILDPDFNPHQDIQALSRAHRIGQKKKVLCFQLMTQTSAEEKIIQIGRRKMALDHVIIEQMDAEDDAGVDMESILRHGAAEILDGETKEVRYDDAAVDRLLDRSQLEDTRAGADQTAESQFSYARVWANDVESMMDSLEGSEDEAKVPDPSVWDKILKERERAAEEEAARRQQALGRGKRARQTVDYSIAHDHHGNDGAPKSRHGKDSDSDTDFMAPQSDANDSAEEQPTEAEEEENQAAANELEEMKENRMPDAVPKSFRPPRQDLSQARKFRRSNVVWPLDPNDIPPELESVSGSQTERPLPTVKRCIACNTLHREGYCPLKIAGPEFCNLCGLAHFGIARTCPHIRSETQVRAMLDALKQSNEPRHLVHEATRYLQGVKGTLAQDKRRRAEKVETAEAMARGINGGGPRMNGNGITGPEAGTESRVPVEAHGTGTSFPGSGGLQSSMNGLGPSSFEQGFHRLATRMMESTQPQGVRER